MAGAGYKTFNVGDVLTAAQVQNYLQDQTVMVFASATARTTALSGVVAEGMVSYLKDTNATEVYDGSAWVGIGNSGDITGVTAGTGISGGGTSGTVTITNSMATEITAAGDIIIGTGSGTFDNLPIGTTGQVLTADTTVSPYKVKWASVSSTPSFVGCLAEDNTNIPSGAYTAFTFAYEQYDTDAFHSTSSNTSRITIPSGKAGYYAITGNAAWGNFTAGIRGIRLYKNGSAFAFTGTTNTVQFFNNNSSTNAMNETFTVTLNLAVADYIEMYGYQDSGATKLTSAFFQVQYLGA